MYCLSSFHILPALQGPLGILPHSARLLGWSYPRYQTLVCWMDEWLALVIIKSGNPQFFGIVFNIMLLGKQTLKWRFTCRKSIECPFGINNWEWGLERRVKEVGLGRERSLTGLKFRQNSQPIPQGDQELGWYSWVVLSWGEREGYLHPHTHS